MLLFLKHFYYLLGLLVKLIYTIIEDIFTLFITINNNWIEIKMVFPWNEVSAWLVTGRFLWGKSTKEEYLKRCFSCWSVFSCRNPPLGCPMSNLFSCYPPKIRCQRQYLAWISINLRTQGIQAVPVDRAFDALRYPSTSPQTIQLKTLKRSVFYFWVIGLRSGESKIFMSKHGLKIWIHQMKEHERFSIWSFGIFWTSSGEDQENGTFSLGVIKIYFILSGDDCLETNNEQQLAGRKRASNRPYQAKRRRTSTSEPPPVQ